MSVLPANWPTARPDLFLDLVRSNRLDPRITFTRGSSATRVNKSGLIELVSNNVPRYDYDPVTLACKGLLIEESRTNLLTYSEQFDNAAWTKSRASISANATTAPDGTVTAYKLVEDTTATQSHLTYQTATTTVGATYSLSVKLKADSRYRAMLQLGAGGPLAIFNLTTGVVVSTGYSGTGAIKSLGNGWYCCTVTGAAAGTSTRCYVILDNGATSTYTGDGTSGIYIWGAQLEAGAFPTSYTPSTETFTSRAGQGSFYGSDGLVQYSGTNLLTRSQEFDDAAWAKARASVSANATTAPDGTPTADTLIEDTASGTHGFASANVSVTSGHAYVLSVYVKQPPAARNLQLIFLSAAFGSTLRATFDLTNGTVATNGGTATITSVGAGWYRCAFAATATATTTTNANINLANGTAATLAAIDYIGDGTSGLFIWGAQLEVGLKPGTYRPTTTAAITANPARLNYNPTNLSVAPKLLLEAQATNRLLWSEDFTNVAWASSSITVTSNAATAPDGTLTADRLTATGANGTELQTITPGAGAQTISVFVRRHTGSGDIQLTADGSTWTTVAVTAAWTRVAVTHTAPSGAIAVGIRIVVSGDAVEVWGAQHESSFATSYIPTTTASVVRSADVSSSAATVRSADAAAMTGTNFSGWYSASEGSLFAEITPATLAAANGVSVNDGTTNNRIKVAATSTSEQGVVTSSGVAQAALDGGTPTAGSTMRLALAYKANDFAMAMNGAAAVTDTSGTVPSVNQIQFGSEASTVGSLLLKRVSYFNTRLSNAVLQNITV